MDRLVEGLALVEEVNHLIENLQESLELFRRGKNDSALQKINSVEDDIEDLNVGNLPDRDQIKKKLSDVLTHLEWVRKNSDRVKEGESDYRHG